MLPARGAYARRPVYRKVSVFMSLKHTPDDASADRRAAIRESLPGLLFGLFTLCITLVGVALLILSSSRSS